MVGATGFEPVTTRTPSVCATRLRYAPTAVLSCRKCTMSLWLNQFKNHGTIGYRPLSVSFSPSLYNLVDRSMRGYRVRQKRMPDNIACLLCQMLFSHFFGRQEGTLMEQ